MEAGIIVDGFKKSLEMHKLRFKRIIGDGDSSVHKKIQAAKPYGPMYYVQKIECRNHVLRNYCNKIREISKIPRTDIEIRNFLRKNVLQFRTAVVSAIKYRKNEDVIFPTKVENLKRDILNGPAHIFGDHSNCANYFCKRVGDNGNIFMYNSFQTSNLYNIFSDALNRVANLSYSLLYDVDNNSVESFNPVVNKFVGGKRINFSLRGLYQDRCFAATVNYNNKETFVYKYLESVNNNIFTNKYVTKFMQNKLKTASKKANPRRKVKVHSADEDYGACDTTSAPRNMICDISVEEYEEKKKAFLNELSLSDGTDIQRKTMNQRYNDEWEKERRFRLTASNFGKVCKMREGRDTANTVKWQKAKFMEFTQLDVASCGLFIDEDYKYLGATPDGLVGLDSIVEIKCPYAARGKTIEEAVNEKLISYITLDPNDISKIVLKPLDNYMYQIQGQLHITKRKQCYFVVYTELDLKYAIIQADDDFWQNCMINYLQKFYINAMLPELLDPRHSRDQPLRNILKKDL
ncbi:hypothetical protein RI129_008410 [Pyrocoelia pectoralis]|uniref:YqaJ viral recombinase domain-containing protein n=1 Tax=Pyrocoelia pectoralis TaxID=417401 RepID=A0AAN7VB65_9COLE